MCKVRTKKPIVPPPFMRGLVNEIANAATDSELAALLENFDAPYHFERSEERNLYNWVDVLNRIDEALENAIKNEETVLLTSSLNDGAGKESLDVTPSLESARLIHLCLRATLRLVNNSTYDTKNVYNSVEHLTALLAKDDETVVLLCLEIVCTLLSRNPRLRPTRAHGSPILGNRLLSLSRGWGGREAGLGLIECCSSMTESLPPEGASIRLEYMKEDASGAASGGEGENGNRGVIAVDNVNDLEGDEKWFLRTYAKEHGLPQRLHFTLSVRYRRAKAFVDGLDARIRHARIRLLALTTLAQMQLTPEPLPIVFHNEPELVSELIGLARADPSDGLENLPLSLRITALKCLTAISNDRHRLGQVLSAAGVASHHGVLPAMIRTEVANLLAENSGTGSGTDGDRGPSVPLDTTTTTGGSNLNNFDSVTHGNFFEALLGLVYALAMAFPVPQGPNSLVLSGTVGTIVPLLSDKNPTHARVVLQGIWALECIIENTHASSGAAAFRDHGGLNLVAQRIVEEVCEEGTGDTEMDDENVELAALAIREESRALYARLAQPMQPSPTEALKTPAPSSSTASRGVLPHSKWALLRALIRLLLHAHGSSEGRTRELANDKLFRALRRLLSRPFHYGGSLFAAAATAAADIAHAEPTATSALAASGLPRALLKSIMVGLPPSGEAIRCIPSVLTAICLAPVGLEEVVKAAPLESYLLRLATPFYGRAMHGDTPIGIGSGLEELKRHVPSLKQEGTSALLSYLKSAAMFVKARDGYDGSASEAYLKSTEDSTKTAAEVDALLDKMRLTVANNAARLGAFAGDVTDSEVADVTQFALETLLDLRYAPAMAGIVSGVTQSSSSSRSAPTASNTLSAIISAIRNFGSGSRLGSIAFKSLFEEIKKDAAVFLWTGLKLEDNWLDEDDPGVQGTESSGGPSVGPEGSRAAAATTNPRDVVVDAADLMKIDAEVEAGEGSSTDVPEIDSAESAQSQRKTRQRALSESARKLRMDIVILSGLSRVPGLPAASWGGQHGTQLGAVIATAERAARWYLARAYTGVTVEMTDEVDFFCTAKVTAVAGSGGASFSEVPGGSSEARNGGQEPPADEATARNSGGDSSRAPTKAERGYTTGPDRKELTGLAWSLATFVASAERMYSTLARSLTATVKKNMSRDTSRHTNTVKALAAMIGRVLTMHLVCASALWQEHRRSEREGTVSAAWDYLRGVLREICAVLFGDLRRTFPAVTQPLVLEAFISTGGAAFLKDALHPRELIAAVVAASEEQGGSSSSSPQHDANVTMPREHSEQFAAANSLPGSSELRSSAASDAFRSGAGSKDPAASGAKGVGAAAREKGSIRNAVVKTAAMDVLDSLGQLMNCLSMCPGLLSIPPNFAKYSDWKPRELHRTAQASAMEVLEAILGEQEKLFSSSTLKERIFSMTIPIVHSVSSTSQELQKDDDESAAGKNRDGLEAQSAEQTATALPDNSMLTQLLDMGFTRERATEALRRAGPGGLPAAAEWLLSHAETEAGGGAGQAADTDNSGGDSTSSCEESGKDKVMDAPEALPSPSMEDMLRACCTGEMESLAKSLDNKIAKGRSEDIVGMAMSMLVPEFVSGYGGATAGSSTENNAMDHDPVPSRPISCALYQEKIESLFSVLRPMATRSIENTAMKSTSKESAFLPVELITALDKGYHLDDATRDTFAETIVKHFAHVVDKLQVLSSVARATSVGGDLERLSNTVQVTAVWMHYGGAAARAALKRKKIVPEVLRFLRFFTEEQHRKQDAVELSPSATDEEAAKPIEGLTLEDLGSKMKPSSKWTTVKDATYQVVAVSLLILDGFVRYRKSDNFVQYGRTLALSAEQQEGASAEPGSGKDTEDKDESMASTKRGEGSEDPTSKMEQTGTDDTVAIKEIIDDTLESFRPLIVTRAPEETDDGFSTQNAMEICLTLLDINPTESPDVICALLQLISSLTEDFPLASMFLDRGALKPLLALPIHKRPYGNTSSGVLRTIIRHLVEDESTLKEAMELETASLLAATMRRASRLAGASPSSLVACATPLLSRDLPAFVEAVAKTSRLASNGNLEPVKQKEDGNVAKTSGRRNVLTVVSALVDILASKDGDMKDSEDNGSTYKLIFFALVRLSELIELSPACARAFLDATVPNEEKTKALDYVLQKYMPVPQPPTNAAVQSAKEDIADASRALFKALCSSTYSVQVQAVDALAAACAAEAEAASPRPGMVKAVAICISFSLKSTVILFLLRSDIAISIARCLDKMDLSGLGGTDIAGAVLKSLDILGQTATNMPLVAMDLDADADPWTGGDDMDEATRSMFEAPRSMFEPPRSMFEDNHEDHHSGFLA